MLRTSSGGLGQEWEYDIMLFLLGVLLCVNILYCVFFCVLFCVTLVVSFFQKLNCFWFEFVFWLCFLVSYYFFFRLGNRRQKNELSNFKLVQSGLGTVGFLFLVMLLVYGLWYLGNCVGQFSLIYFLSNRVKEKLETCYRLCELFLVKTQNLKTLF